MCPRCGVDVAALSKTKEIVEGKVSTADPSGMPKHGAAVTILALVGALFLVWIVIKPTPEREVATRPSAMTQEMPDARRGLNENLSSEECYNRGYATATVYLANIKDAAAVGLMPLDMMTEGCQRISSDGINPSSCANECLAGFRASVSKFSK